jgi:hypothetical protein
LGRVRSLGIPFGKSFEAPEEKFPGYIRKYGFDLAYQRFLWKGVYTAIHVMPAWQTFVNDNGNKIDNGFQIFNTYRVGYHIKLFKDRFFIEPSIAVTHRGNVEINYTTKKMMFEYSHGFSLDPSSSGGYKNQKLSLHLPYSTGIGIGYRINSNLDIRFESKLHSWEVYYMDEEQKAENKIKEYKTYTLGVGIYYRYFPFKNNNSNLLQGITTSTSLRWWQNVGSTLDNNEFSYTNKFSNKMETLKAANIGIGNTPLIFNVAIGYTLGGK